MSDPEIQHLIDTDKGLPPRSKSRKNLVIGGVVGLVVLAIVLIFVFAGGSGGGDDPVDPVDPTAPTGYNPYSVDPNTLSQTTNEAKGYLQMSQSALKLEAQRAQRGAAPASAAASNDAVAMVNPQNIPSGENNQKFTNISFEMVQVDFQIARLVMTNASDSATHPPLDFVKGKEKDWSKRLDMISFELLQDHFGFKFHDRRNTNGEWYFSTEDQALFMMEKYSQIDIKIPSQRLFGFGERFHEFKLSEGAYTLWARDNEGAYDNGQGGLQGSSVHPFVLAQSKNPGEYVGLYFRSTTAMAAVVKFNDDGTTTFSYSTTNGVLDVYFFAKGTAMDIIRLYQNIVGKPMMPPFWALGWHTTSMNYLNASQVEANIDSYNKSGVPLEGVWLSNTYLDKAKSTSVDPNFGDIKQLAGKVRTNGQRLMVALEPGLVSDDDFFKQALKEEALIKSTINSADKGALITDAFRNQTAFLDLFNEKGVEIFNSTLDQLFEQINFDGFWLDMNQIQTACDGECPSKKASQFSTAEMFLESSSTLLGDRQWFKSYDNQSVDSTFFLPFIPAPYDLDNETLSLNASHASSGRTQFDLHNLNGHIQANRTSAWLQDKYKDKRTFQVSQSTFPGSGAYAGHTLDKANREFSSLNYAVSGIMNFNMFGIPMTGADVCGTREGRMDKEEWAEICGRWYQLSTFFPFARHNQEQATANFTEPYQLPKPYNTWAIRAIQDRMKLLQQLYTCLYSASQDGGTCFDPMLFHYPEDDNVFDNTEEAFVFADSLMVLPLVPLNVTKIEGYFPAGHWVNFNNFSDVVTVKCPKSEASNKAENWDCVGHYGERKLIKIASGEESMMPTYLMPGSMVAVQETVNSTKDLKDVPITMLANRDQWNHAEGKLYLDDGISVEQPSEHYKFVLSANSIKKWVLNEDQEPYSYNRRIDKFVLTNADDLKDIDFACYVASDSIYPHQVDVHFNEDEKTVSFSVKDGFITSALRDIYFGKSDSQVNLCADPTEYYYHTEDFKVPDLSSNTVSFTLKHTSPAILPLQMTLSLLDQSTDFQESTLVNIVWDFHPDAKPLKKPFQAPVTVNKTRLAKAKLEDFISITQDTNAGFQLTVQTKEGTTVYSLEDMLYSEYFSRITQTAHTLPSVQPGVMGLSERTVHNLFLEDGVYSLWTMDAANPPETKRQPGMNTYGMHPFYMGIDFSNNWFGVFTNVAAAQDWWVENDQPSGKTKLTSMSTGGVSDVYILFSNSPDGLAQQYQIMVGLPVFVPQWAYGWHHSRWSYSDTEKLREVVRNYSEGQMPLDVQWSDIDYMENYKDFTIDPENFADLPQWVDTLHDDLNMKYMFIVDAAISQRDGVGYEAYEDGKEQDIFVKNDQGQILETKVWPGDTVFPDFANEKGKAWWKKWLSKLHDQVAFDGVWEDMNEAANFNNGPKFPFQSSKDPLKHKLVYVPSGRDLETKAMPLDAVHATGDQEIDIHSLFGMQETMVTDEWFKEQGMRTMNIERSAYAGTGKYSSRWLGDNHSEQQFLGYSIPSLMMHNVLGIPFVGADVCGFRFDTNADLCARWHVVGAFYPFSRNHNAWDSIAQEPWVWKHDLYEGQITYYNIMQMAIRMKYHMIRYYYTEIMRLSFYGGAFFKPMFFSFPNDNACYAAQETNIMLGDALKLSVLTTGSNNSTDYYFPAGTWCDVFKPSEGCFKSTGESKTLPSKAYDFHVHLREGYIVPLQDATALSLSNKMNTTHDLQQYPVDFHVNYKVEDDGSLSAEGRYYNDDGVTLGPQNDGKDFNSYKITGGGQNGKQSVNLRIEASGDKKKKNANDELGKIVIYNARDLGFTEDSYSFIVDRGTQFTVTGTVDSNGLLIVDVAGSGQKVNLFSVKEIKTE